MKKQIIPKKSGLNLDKRTISNLSKVELNLKAGGGPVDTRKCYTEWKCTRKCSLVQNELA